MDTRLRYSENLPVFDKGDSEIEQEQIELSESVSVHLQNSSHKLLSENAV